MCGITGIWNLDKTPVSANEIDRFTDALTHRGPDGRGVWFDNSMGLALGHRRLTILDLSEEGRQPMSYASGRYHITFNGEIYNFLELRTELEEFGHNFRSQSDTEVILAAYHQWGEQMLLRFNGMWGLAIWDTSEKKLFLARDRFGVKPLHYFFDGKRFAFASEQKAFSMLERFDLEFDNGVIARAIENFTRIEGTEFSIIKGVRRLNGGHSMTIDSNGRLKINRWWNTLDHLIDAPDDYEQQVVQFKEIFTDACRLRMRSDVPLGTALSGGLDSSSVHCVMAQIARTESGKQRIAQNWQQVFIAEFPGTSQDERIFAEQVVNYTGASPNFLEIKALDIVKRIDKILFDFEEIYDIPGAPYLIYEEMRRQGVVVSLDGHGGDELLAGYHHYPRLAMMDAFVAKDPKLFHKMHRLLLEMYPEGTAPAVEGYASLAAKRRKAEYKILLKKMGVGHLYRMLKWIIGKKATIPSPPPPSWLLTSPASLEYPGFNQDQERLAQFSSLNQTLYNDFHYTILPTILRNFDRLSMAHGIEIRAPLMDWRLVTMAFSLDAQSKLADHTKKILRDAVEGKMPEEIRMRKNKIGFASPLVDWYRLYLKEFVLDMVNSRSFLESPIWNGPLIKEYTEKCYATKNYAGARRSWEYIQTMKLMEMFRKKNAKL